MAPRERNLCRGLSSVARRASGELADTVIVDQPAAKGGLIGGRVVIHVEYLVSRPYMHLRIAVTIQAPGHRQRRRLPRERHAVYTPVALGAADSLVEVNAVIE